MRISGLVTFIVLIALSACSQNGRVDSKPYGILLSTLLDHSVNEMEVAELLVDERTFCFIDAREKGEFDVSHIKSAVWVGYDDFDMSRMSGVSKEDMIIVYCSVGYRSEKVVEKLDAAGYEFVWNLYGGIFEWKNQGGQVVDEEGKVTDRVHAFDRKWGMWLQSAEKVFDQQSDKHQSDK